MKKTLVALRRFGVRAAVLAIVAAVLAVAIGAGVRLLPKYLDDSRKMCAYLTDATGLYKGNKVKLLDLEVGEVTSIANMPESVRVEFTVPKDLDLPADEGVVTMSDSIVTDRHLELSKPYADGPKFQGAQCIGLESTKTPVDISEAFSSVKDLADTILGDKDGEDPSQAPGAVAINDTLKATARSLDGMGEPMKKSLLNLVAAIGDPYQLEADYHQLMMSGAGVTSEVIKQWGLVTKMLNSVPGLTKSLRAGMGELALLFEHLNEILHLAVPLINRFAPRIYNLADKIVPWVSGVASWLTPQIIWVIDQLPPVMNWLTNYYQPGWGPFDLTYSPPQEGGSGQPMATALCDALKARNVPGIETTCAPGADRGDGTSLTDLLMGAAVR